MGCTFTRVKQGCGWYVLLPSGAMMRLWMKKCAGTDTGLIRGTGTGGKLDSASVLTVIEYTDR